MKHPRQSRVLMIALLAFGLVMAAGVASFGASRAPAFSSAFAPSAQAAAVPASVEPVTQAKVAPRALKPPKGTTFHGSQAFMRNYYTSKRGRMAVHCTFTHRAKDDPIVYYAQFGKSHLHDFFGNVATNAVTTPTDLSNNPTTCTDPSDHSAYWVPEAIQDAGTSVSPLNVGVFYYGAHATRKLSGGRYTSVTSTPVVPFPTGFRAISGRTDATIEWKCWGSSGFTKTGSNAGDVPVCGHDENLMASIKFPSCWDGQSLDSADHQSHLIFENKNTSCPRRAPFHLPMVTMFVAYPPSVGTGGHKVWVSGGPGFSLASGGAATMHADIFENWLGRRQQQLIRTCLNAHRNCAPPAA